MRAVAFTKIQRIDKLRLYRMGFVAWQQCSRESIKEKLWFKVHIDSCTVFWLKVAIYCRTWSGKETRLILECLKTEKKSVTLPDPTECPSFLEKQHCEYARSKKKYCLYSSYGFGGEQIFSFVAGNIDDLCRCARVCRSWKMLTQDNVLWSSLNLAPLKN